jgi:hypothetical protein
MTAAFDMLKVLPVDAIRGPPKLVCVWIIKVLGAWTRSSTSSSKSFTIWHIVSSKSTAELLQSRFTIRKLSALDLALRSLRALLKVIKD